MQQSRQETTSSDISKAFQPMSAEDIAKHLKYYLQFNKSKVSRPIPLNRIQSRGFYLLHYKTFDKMSVVFNKYEIDIDKYLYFFVNVLHKAERSINDDLLSPNTLNEFVTWLTTMKRRKNIYKWILKSINNIVAECKKKHIYSARDYLKMIVRENLIGPYHASGKISKYYFAAIPKFDKIIPKLDYFSRAELDDLKRLFAVYSTEVQDAFLYLKNQKFNPLKSVDKLLYM